MTYQKAKRGGSPLAFNGRPKRRLGILWRAVAHTFLAHTLQIGNTATFWLKRFFKKLCVLGAFLLGAFLLSACAASAKFDMVKIWTSESSIVLYAAEWNKTHSTKLSVLYKAFPLDDLGTTHTPPDIIIGTWLRNKETKKEFYALDKLFGKSALSPLQTSTFYEKVLDAGRVDGTQYLLPISFNVPVVISGVEAVGKNKSNPPRLSSTLATADKNSNKALGDKAANNSDSNKALATSGNGDKTLSNNDKSNNSNDNSADKAINGSPSTNGNLVPSSIELADLKGRFMAQSSDDFLYFYTKARSVSYTEVSKHNGEKLPFTYDEKALQKAIEELKGWAQSFGGVEKEREFVYKWLRVPDEKKLSSGAQFAYTTSDKVAPGEKVSFITLGGELPIEDNLLMMGLLKRGNNKMGAMKVVEWFFKEDVQKSFIDLTKNSKSDIKVFGVAGGYSSVKALNGGIFPHNASFCTFEQKPRNWEALKRAVIIPYIKDALSSKDNNILPMSARYNKWRLEQ